MGSFKVLDERFDEHVKKKYKPKCIELKPSTVVVTVEDTKEFAAACKEFGKLKDEIILTTFEEFNKIVKGCADELKYYDTQLEKFPELADKIEADCERCFKDVASNTEKALKDIPQEVWAETLKNNKEYKKYKLKSAVKVTMGSISLIVSTILTGVGGWTGAGTVIGIIGLIRSASTLGQQIYQLAIDAEKVLKGLESDLDKLEDRYKDASKNAVGGQEVALKVWAQVTTVELTSISKSEGQVDSLESKFKGIKEKAQSFASNVNQTIEKQDKLKKELEDYKKTLMDVASLSKDVQDAIKQTETNKKVLEKAEKALDVQLKAVDQTNDRIEAVGKGLKDVGDRLELLQSKDPKWSQVAKKLTPVLELGLSTSWSDVAGTLPGIAADLDENFGVLEKLSKKIGKG
jgi:chromosome segregation ATPase